MTKILPVWCLVSLLNIAPATAQIPVKMQPAIAIMPDNPTAIPDINFEISQASVTEKTTDSTGCRKYTDYTYNMTIGAAPSKTAIVTLVATGTAAEGLDYNITANGNFGSPSKLLTFATGVTTIQHFSVRIYDDKSIESTDTLYLTFTLNNGGGNASIGVTRPKLTIIINDRTDIIPQADVTNTYGFGEALVGLFESPFDGRKASGINKQKKSQAIYKKKEMVAAGMTAGKITGLSLNIVKVSLPGTTYQNFTIKMAQTAQQHLYTASPAQFPLNDAAHTIVYSANTTPVDGWNDITFTTPFTWDGNSNLVLTFCYSGSTSDTIEYCSFYADSTYAALVGDYVLQGSTNCATPFSSFNLSQNGNKPSIRFKESASGTSIQSIISGRQEYLGPFADVYFYDSTQNKLLARIKNLSSFDYGCTKVEIDRSGQNTSPFWNNTAASYLTNKTIRVTPTINNPNGQYQVTLYYTPEEVYGWQVATGLNFNNIQLVKVQGQISSITPSNPIGTGLITVVNSTVAALGNNKSVTATFNNGFSGFGAGILINNIYTFNGNGNWNNAANWSNNTIPPATLPAGSEIIINPSAGGECIVNVSQTISQGALLIINPGIKLKVAGNLNMLKH